MGELRIRDILSEGSIIKTKLSGCTKWVTNIVHEIDDDCIEIDIGLEKEYVDNMIMAGDTIKCKYTVDDNQDYVFIGWVSKIKTDYPQNISIRIHQIEKFENRRDSVRYDVYLSSTVKIHKMDNRGMFAVVTSISKSGAAFIVKDEIETHFSLGECNLEETAIFLEVYISSERRIDLEGLIKRKVVKEKGIEYAVKTIDMDLESTKVLDDFTNELANKDKEIYNKRSGFWSKNSNLKK